MIMKKLQSLIFFLLLSIVLQPIRADHTPSPAAETNSSGLSTLQQQIISSVSGPGTEKGLLLQTFRNSGIFTLLSQVPSSVLQPFLQQLKTGLTEPFQAGYNIYKNFSNWADTVHADLLGILYPSAYSPYSNLQVSLIQKFVKDGAAKGKRVRCAGSRHSFSNIFSDEHQLLVSFYPPQLIGATSTVIDNYVFSIMKLDEVLKAKNIEHLSQIRKVGEVNVDGKQSGRKCGCSSKRHLVKIGAGVTNTQLRIWCKKNGYQIKSNALISQATVVGAIGTCSHGSGLETQTLCDYVYQVQFIDHNGKRQTVSKSDRPDLLRSAASSLGLLGPIIFATLEMEELQIVKFEPYINYKDFVVPWPKDYARKQERLSRPERIKWENDNKPAPEQKDWESNFKKFKESIDKTYVQWFYPSIQGTQVFQNVWQNYGPKTPQNIAKIKANNQTFVEEYPSPQVVALSEFSNLLGNELASNKATLNLLNEVLKQPFGFWPQSQFYVNQPDAVHFLRGLHNFKARVFQVMIDIPYVKVKGKMQLDYDLIQKVWWTGLEIVQANKEILNYGQQMRLFKGSQATLAPGYRYDIVCGIQFVSVAVTPCQQSDLKKVRVQLWNALKNLTDSEGNKVTIRPHWAKEWTDIQTVKSDVFADSSLRDNFKKFLDDYRKIAKLKCFDQVKNLKTFSNDIYRGLLNKAIVNKGQKIQ